MTKIMILGDVHADTTAAVRAVKFAAKHDVELIMQVGDFLYDGRGYFLVNLNETLRKYGLEMWSVRGNHDDPAKYDYANQHLDGYFMSNIRLLDRVEYFNIGDKRCLAVGGAASIDKDWREPGVSWWPGEYITDEDVDKVETKHVDYLFTHDASNRTSFNFALMVHPESEICRQQIDRVLAKSTPDYHWHGHYHARINWVNMYRGGLGNKLIQTQTYGLACNGMEYYYSTFDTRDGTHTFHRGYDRI